MVTQTERGGGGGPRVSKKGGHGKKGETKTNVWLIYMRGDTNEREHALYQDLKRHSVWVAAGK